MATMSANGNYICTNDICTNTVQVNQQGQVVWDTSKPYYGNVTITSNQPIDYSNWTVTTSALPINKGQPIYYKADGTVGPTAYLGLSAMAAMVKEEDAKCFPEKKPTKRVFYDYPGDGSRWSDL